MSETPDSIPLCRFEELVRRENRQRPARSSASVAAPEQLPGADNLKGDGVDIPDRLSGGESKSLRTWVTASAGFRFSLIEVLKLQNGDRGAIFSLTTIARTLLLHRQRLYAASGAKRLSISTRLANRSSSV